MKEIPEVTANDYLTAGRERAVFYARYSSPRQRRASIEDQYRNCREAAEEHGWLVLPQYHRADDARTGVTLLGRKGIQELVALAKLKPRPFDVIVIDDTSRLGRNVGDVCKLADIIDFAGVKLYFVADELISGNESFREAFIAKASADEQFSRKHGKRVRRGRVGRFDAGFNPGGGCYGYKNEKVFDYTKRGDHGEPGLKGMKEVIDPETSQIVLRMYEAADAYMSDRDMVLMLANEGIRPPQPTGKRDHPSWSKGAVSTILTNQRYLGIRVYGKTKEKRNPETGDKVRIDLPESEWRVRDKNPELQIVPDDLFYRVQEKRRLKSGQIGVQRVGGMMRTEASRAYLFSGLLKCGFCGGNLTIRTSNPPRYGCREYTDRGLCRNSATIFQSVIEQEFIRALSARLSEDSLREELVQTVFNLVQANKNNWFEQLSTVQKNRDYLETNRATQVKQKENLVKAVRDSGGMRALYEELELVTRSIERIDEQLVALNQPDPPEITLEEIRAFVDDQMTNLEQVLHGAAEDLKMDFQRRISKIVVTPGKDGTGRFFMVTGDIALFAMPEGVVQTKPVYPFGLHYTLPVQFSIRPNSNRPRWDLPAAA